MMNRDELEYYYVEKGLSMAKTAKALGVSRTTVFNYLKKYGIKSHENTGSKGYKHTEEAKRRISKFHKNRVISEETRRKMSESRQLEKEGHKKHRRDGYIALYYPNHPKANKEGYIMEHRYVMEKAIGRMLKEDEVVHHINHIRNDNRLDNLKLMTFKQHASLHMREYWKKKKGEMTY